MNVLSDLSDRYAALKEEEPKLRIRDAADRLGVSELELVVLDPRTTRLRPAMRDWLRGLPGVGRAMALTRNPWCVHERRGAWSEPSFHGPGIGLVVGADIDLRLFMRSWAHLVHTVVDNARGPLRSFQVFDAHGQAVHKVYATADTDLAAWEALVGDLADAEPEPLAVTPAAPVTLPEPGPLDVDAFREAWAALKDTHDFFPMLRRFDVHRLHAMRAVGAPWARPVDGVAAVRSVLEGAAADGHAIMVFVGNPGAIQIHTGPVERIVERGPWINVLDPDFDLHLRLDAIAEAYAVRKPTEDGDVHSLELYAEDGSLIAQLFGARKPGIPEDPAWTARVAGLA